MNCRSDVQDKLNIGSTVFVGQKVGKLVVTKEAPYVEPMKYNLVESFLHMYRFIKNVKILTP